MKRKIIIYALAVALVLTLGFTPAAFAGTAAENPNAPSYIMSNFGEDAQTEMLVSWQNSISDQYLEIAVYSDILYSQAERYTAEVTSFEIAETGWQYSRRYVCRVSVTGLTQATKYRYRVGNDDCWSLDYSHMTAAGDGKFSFSVFSDPQASSAATYNTNTGGAIKAALRDNPSSSFFLLNGDIAEVGGIEAHYSSFFDAMTAAKTVPIVTAPGNHDTIGHVLNTDGSQNYNENFGEARVYNSLFHNPGNGPDFPLSTPNNPKNSSYYFYYDNALIVMLNTQYNSAELRLLAAWLDGVLADNEQNARSQYIMVGMHKGPIGNYYYGSSAIASINSIFCPVFEKYKVDLVMSGHDHTYARTAPTVSNNAAGALDGTVYTIVGSCGPKFNTAKDGASEQFVSSLDKQRTGLVTNIYVDTKGLSVDVKYVDGEAVDKYFIPAKRGVSKDFSVSADCTTTATTATVSYNLSNLVNVKGLRLERQNETLIAEPDKFGSFYTVTGLTPKSTYALQLRVLFNDGSSTVKRFNAVTRSFLEYSGETNSVRIAEVPDSATSYSIFVNNKLYDNMLISQTVYPLYGMVSGGSYLIKAEIYNKDVMIEYDYVFITK